MSKKPEWCPGGPAIAPASWGGLGMVNYGPSGSCPTCGKWCKLTKTSMTRKHKRYA